MPSTIVRRSLIDEVVAVVRRNIIAGDYKGFLQPERRLAISLGVSRPTLRLALKQLESEGFLAVKGSQGRKVLASPKRKKSPKELSVGLLLPVERLDELRYQSILWIDEVRRILYGWQIAMHVYQNGFATDSAEVTFFKKLTATTRHDCWILPSSNQALQEWCAAKRMPVVIVGTLREKGSLPSVVRNYRAASHHAAGQLLRFGHRQLVIVLDQQERGGGVDSRLGFLEGVKKVVNTKKVEAAACDEAVFASVAYHDGTVADLCRLTDRLMNRQPRPTAWLIASPSCFLTVMTHLLHCGVRIPEDVSLVCGDADPYLSRGIPEPTRYVFDIRSFARQIARLAQKVANGHTTPESVDIIPDLVPGKTLAPPANAGVAR
ncbi:GntR family transcriptional regulator [Opitutaceae bacterium TAV4]|nr:GntR family transcriptional regulator [Opitutaceae bacterium TAV4]RRK00940.1 GntR family transcriptional regulator [Opitutaceae bacterium TAV3]